MKDLSTMNHPLWLPKFQPCALDRRQPATLNKNDDVPLKVSFGAWQVNAAVTNSSNSAEDPDKVLN